MFFSFTKEEIEDLEQGRQEVWLDIFERDARQGAYLFEVILFTGANQNKDVESNGL